MEYLEDLITKFHCIKNVFIFPDAPSSPQNTGGNSLLNDFMGLQTSQPSQNTSVPDTNNQVIMSHAMG